MEKPLAASAEDADAIVAAADGSKQLVGMDIGMRWNPALAALRQEVASGSLGNLTAARLTMHYKQWPREWQVQEWCAGRAEGGPLREVGTHYFFGIMEIFGHGCVRRVQARVVYPDGPEGTTHHCSALGHAYPPLPTTHTHSLTHPLSFQLCRGLIGGKVSAG